MNCFKAYDIRGKVPEELNEEIAYRVGRAYARFLRPSKVVVGRDVRLSSESICGAVSKGLCDSGVDVYDIGVCGTEEVYFATSSERVGGGIMVTASHNPKDYNGMKFVREGSKPISGETGLNDIRDLAIRNDFVFRGKRGSVRPLEIRAKYLDHLMGYVEPGLLGTRKVVANSGNGGAGEIIDLLERRLPISFIKVRHHPDGNFPHGIPNPLLPENRDATIRAVRESGADMGLAWDGDFDRCFFFDEKGDFIEGYYIVGLIAAAVLSKHPGARIVHDPRLTWNTMDLVSAGGGISVMSRTGHAFIKERMRREDAVYGGEMSGHHYFREFSYCDSGMIPWLMVLEIMGRTGRSLSELVGERILKFPSGGEINRRVNDTVRVLEEVERRYASEALSLERVDGLSMEFGSWRFNLRASNTEPLLRLNVESRGDRGLMLGKTEELLKIIDHV